MTGKSKFDKIEEKLNDHESRIVRLEESMKRTNDELREIKNSIGDMNDKVGEMHTTLTEIKTKVDMLIENNGRVDVKRHTAVGIAGGSAGSGLVIVIYGILRLMGVL